MKDLQLTNGWRSSFCKRCGYWHYPNMLGPAAAHKDDKGRLIIREKA